jgi:serine phosphatase RsbU (regulator of sigma subunit)
MSTDPPGRCCADSLLTDGQLTRLGEGQSLVGADGEGLASAARLAVLRQAGLSAAPDEGLERFARLVASVLAVPVALVSLVEADRQVFPGMVGLAEPWATSRQTPLSHSLCQHVAASGSPLVLPDARLDERTCTNLAIDDLGVIAYAGMPLTDGLGYVLGSLCAIDQRPRAWSPQELANLADLAAACSGELRLRIMSQLAQQTRDDAERAGQAAEAARLAAEQSDAQARASAAQVAVALQRSQLMLRAAEDLANTASLVEVRRSVRNLVISDLKPSYVGLILLDGQQLRRIPDPEITYPADIRTPNISLDIPLPSARVVRTGEIVIVSDRSTLEAEYGPAAVAEFDAQGLQAAVCVPLPGTRRTLGTLILGWASPHRIDVSERAVLTSIAGYTAQAIERALHLDDRITVARQLQQAMLTDLPDVPGLELAAAYHPAAVGELVGGDWYDAYPLATRSCGSGAGRTAVATSLAITVGDITGHDMRAAAVMGQVRSMLRQADLHNDLSPAGAVTAVEESCERLSLEATGTLIHGHLRPAGGAAWRLTWTNAGHPPLLLCHLDGQTEQLGEHDLLLWPGLPDSRRTDWQRALVPGDTLLLYTDGLVEHRTQGVDIAISDAAALLSAAPAGQPLPDLLSQLIDAVAGATSDDIALLAVRIPEASPA